MKDLKSILQTIEHIEEYKESLLPIIKHIEELINLLESKIKKNEDPANESKEINETEITKKFDEFKKVLEKQGKLNDDFLQSFIEDAKNIINEKLKNRRTK